MLRAKWVGPRAVPLVLLSFLGLENTNLSTASIGNSVSEVKNDPKKTCTTDNE
jgi:hypothetical protein